MEIAETAFLKNLDVLLLCRGLQFTRTPYLSEKKGVEYLLFPARGGRKRRPLGIRIALHRDDKDSLRGFTHAEPMRTKYGDPSRIYVQGAARAGEEAVADLIGKAFAGADPPGDAGVEWIGGWLVFDPAKRHAELGGEPPAATPEPEPETVPPEPIAEAVAPAPTSARGGERVLRLDRSVVSTAARGPHGSGRRRDGGLVFEDRLGEEMRRRGLSFSANKFLDRKLKTDFLIVHCESGPPIRPIALQVTLRWNDLLKLEHFLAAPSPVRIGKVTANRLYLQIADGVGPETVAEAVRDQVKARRQGGSNKRRRVFAEIDADGMREFDVKARMKELRQRADPRVTGSERVEGSIVHVANNGIRLSCGRNAYAWAFISEIADPALLKRVRMHQHDEKSAIGVRVSFIYSSEENPGGDPRAMSAILAPRK